MSIIEPELHYRESVKDIWFMGEAILVIGESRTVRKALCDRLAMAFPHYQIFEATDSQGTEAMILNMSPRLVVLDIGPPAVERLGMIQRIKAARPLAKIVVWSIHDWPSYQADALAAGATAYVLKEGTQDKLLTVLSAML